MDQVILQMEITQTQGMSINDQITNLIYWLQQEILSPELLSYQMNATEENPKTIQDLLKDQSDAIQNIKQLEHSKNKQKEIQYLTLHVIEFERIQFLYTEYLRIRMKKIVENAFYYYNERREMDLSINERDVMKKIVRMQVEHLQNMCLNYFPARLRGIGIELHEESQVSQLDEKEQKKVPEPQLRKYVFISVRTSRTITVGQMNQPLIGDEQAFVCYADVRKYVNEGTVQLI